MWGSDSRSELLPTEQLIRNNELINVETVSAIERELQDNVYDMTSLVFLLYEVPDTALQKLVVYHRVSKDAAGTNLNLLHEWYQHEKSKPTWKHEFIEALMTCQLYSIVRRLGLHVSTMKRYYQSDVASFSMFINPIKKLLYRACENMTSDNLEIFKRSLQTYYVDTGEHNVCELVFLELMCQKFIKINFTRDGKRTLGSEVDVEKLTRIMSNMPGLRKIAIELRDFHDTTNEKDTNIPSTSQVNEDFVMCCEQPKDSVYKNNDFFDVFEKFSKLSMDNATREFTKSDATILMKNTYKIKDPNKLGVCLIINQENFFPSKDSIENDGQRDCLETRSGSTADRLALEKTMTSLNFTVYSYSDKDYRETIQCIKKAIKKVNSNDSIFMLCILSHGIRGHVFAADSVTIKVEDIQNLLDSDEASHLRGIPKVFIIQACQVDDKPQSARLAADSNSRYYLRKSDFLVYWATAPEYEAYRHEKFGSLFIQGLCSVIKNNSKLLHLYEIFTEVTNTVTSICTQLRRAQMPIFESTLRKNLFLQLPD